MWPVYTWMRDIGVYDTSRDRRTYSYTREHGYVRARTYPVDSLSTNLPATTQYGTRIVMPFTKGRCDTLAREK